METQAPGAPGPNPSPAHVFLAVAFVENLSLKELASSYPEARRTVHELGYRPPAGGEVFIFPFGVVVFMDVPAPAREAELARLHRVRPRLTRAVINEEFSVREDPGREPDVAGGILTLDRLTHERASIIASTVAQSAAMEYYERIVEGMFDRTERLVERLEARGTVRWLTRPLHRFIGAAIGTRNEVLSILHLLDKPDEAWEDPGMDRIYGELRAEFDLVDRYQSLELKLRSVQEALELVLDVARDRRLVLLEATIVVLIVLEIILTLFRVT
jgi:required for meiotic nuclear division protein 1